MVHLCTNMYNPNELANGLTNRDEILSLLLPKVINMPWSWSHMGIIFSILRRVVVKISNSLCEILIKLKKVYTVDKFE